MTYLVKFIKNITCSLGWSLKTESRKVKAPTPESCYAGRKNSRGNFFCKSSKIYPCLTGVKEGQVGQILLKIASDVIV